MPGRTDSVERTGSCAGRMAQTVTRIIPEMNVFMAKSIRLAHEVGSLPCLACPFVYHHAPFGARVSLL